MSILLALTGCLFAGGVSGKTLLSDLDSDDASKLCEDFEKRTVDLACDGDDLTILPSVLPSCRTALTDISSDCGLTVNHLEDCVAEIEEATCDSDLRSGVCEALFDEDCEPLLELAAEMIGDLASLDNVRVSDLTEAQIESFCGEQDYEDYTITCDGVQIEVDLGTPSDCEASFRGFPECSVTMADYQSCVDAINLDLCDFDLPSACDAWVACFD